jgi:hypothetical protein
MGAHFTNIAQVTNIGPRTFLITPNGVIDLDQVSCILTVDNGLTLELSGAAHDTRARGTRARGDVEEGH